MPQQCTVCTHQKTEEIDRALIGNKSTRQIARKYNLDHTAIWRHSKNHLPEKLVKAAQKKDQMHAENMLDGITDLLTRTKNILDDAEAEGQKTTALRAISEARSTYELLSKIAVKLEEYRRQDEDKKDQYLTHQVQKGLQALSTKELKLFVQLLAKIKSADPNYDLDPDTRQFINGIDRIFSTPLNEHNPHSTPSSHYDPSNPSNGQGQMTRTKDPRIGDGQPQQPQTQEDQDVEMIDDLDLDLDDLDLDKDNTIPSIDDEPEWLKNYRDI